MFCQEVIDLILLLLAINVTLVNCPYVGHIPYMKVVDSYWNFDKLRLFFDKIGEFQYFLFGQDDCNNIRKIIK